MKLFIKKLFSEKSILVSIISIVFSCVGILGLCEIIINITKIGNTYIIIYVIIIIAIGTLTIIKSIYSEIQTIKIKENFILCGIGIKGSKYSVLKYLEKESKDIIIVSQNMSSLSTCTEFKEKINRAIANDVNIIIILTPYTLLKNIGKAYASDLVITIKILKDIINRLGTDKRKKLTIKFNREALSLSTFFIDPDDPEKGVAIFSPKLTYDDPANNRLYCIIKKSDNYSIFQNIYGSIGNMISSKSTNLTTEINKMKKDGYSFE